MQVIHKEVLDHIYAKQKHPGVKKCRANQLQSTKRFDIQEGQEVKMIFSRNALSQL